MRAEPLDEIYGVLSNALGRVGEADAPLFLATLVLDLIARESDASFVGEAIDRAERLVRSR